MQYAGHILFFKLFYDKYKMLNIKIKRMMIVIYFGWIITILITITNNWYLSCQLMGFSGFNWVLFRKLLKVMP